MENKNDRFSHYHSPFHTNIATSNNVTNPYHNNNKCGKLNWKKEKECQENTLLDSDDSIRKLEILKGLFHY